MNRSAAFKSALIALACFALGFLVADRMTTASASAPPVPQDGIGAAFSGTDGAVVVKNYVLVFRGKKIYRVDPSDKGGAQRSWGELAE